ncbi:MAG TPA: hypothetical protein VL068_02005 [Microthrixaceae bacterium]|nr:hypothetical protein [Microthrixaceae bacterium]
MSKVSSSRLRRPTLVSAPLFVIGLMGTSFAVALTLWAVWNSGELGSSFWVPFVVSLLVGLGGFGAGRGCFVDVGPDEVVDVIAWVRFQKISRPEIESIRVRSGFWRFFELTMDDGRQRVLLGATPAQFPSRLLPSAREQDLSDIDMILGT